MALLLNGALNLRCRGLGFIVLSTWVANDYRKLLTGLKRIHMGRRILNPSDNGKEVSERQASGRLSLDSSTAHQQIRSAVKLGVIVAAVKS